MENMSNPHPEARGEDIERLDTCIRCAWNWCDDSMAVDYFREALSIVSRLAAPKPEGQDIIRCEITAGEYPDRISVKPPADTFERGLVVMGAMVDLVFRPAAPEPRPAEVETK